MHLRCRLYGWAFAHLHPTTYTRLSWDDPRPESWWDNWVASLADRMCEACDEEIFGT